MVGEGRVVGRLLAGLVDDVVVHAAAEGRPVVDTSIDDAAADGAGLLCGGSATLVLTPVADLPDELFAWLAEARPVALATPLGGGGRAMAVTDRAEAGGLGDVALDEQVAARARQLLGQGSSGRSVEEAAGASVLVSAVVPRPRVLVVGGGPVAEALDAQVRLLGWSAARCDDAPAALAFLDRAGPGDGVVVLSHDPDLDTPVLAAAVEAGVGYVGAMGSRSTQAGRRQRLADRGIPAERLARIHGPIGLDLGTRTPAETAVAIVAEVLASRSGRTAASLTGGTGPING